MSADLFLEPPPGDCHQKDFTINVMYEDGQTGNANATGQRTHRSQAGRRPQGAGRPAARRLGLPDGRRKALRQARGHRPGDAAAHDPLARPSRRPAGPRRRRPHRPARPQGDAESFAKRLKTRGSEDLLLAQTKNGEVIAISGIVEGTEGDKLRFRYQDRTRTLPLKQVEGLVLAARPESQPPDELRPTFTLPGGVVVSGRWKDLDTSVWKIEPPGARRSKLPAAEIQDVRFRGGKMTYLSDLKPSKVEETPFFGHRLPWRRDVNLLGEPLKMNGQTYRSRRRRPLAVRPDLRPQRPVLHVRGPGRVRRRGQGQGARRLPGLRRRQGALRQSRPPGRRPPGQAHAAGRRGRAAPAVVDFGRGQDTGDRVIWANARLYRQAPTQVAQSSLGADPTRIPGDPETTAQDIA